MKAYAIILSTHNSTTISEQREFTVLTKESALTDIKDQLKPYEVISVGPYFNKPHWITLEEIRANKLTHIYIYGDTRTLDSNGGQASAARGEPNAFAIPVKYAKCYNDYTAFFTDMLYDTNKELLLRAFSKLPQKAGKTIVVFPKLGEGFNEMPKRAPITYSYLQGLLHGYLLQA